MMFFTPLPALRACSARLVASAAIALVALTGCDALGGDTTVTSVGSTAPATASTVAAPDAVDPTPTASHDAGEAGEAGEADAPTESEPLVIPDEIVEVDAEPEAETPAASNAPEPISPADDAAGEPEIETASFEQQSASTCLEGVWEAAPGEVNRFMSEIGHLTGVNMSAAGDIHLALHGAGYIYSTQVETTIDHDGFVTKSVVDGITRGTYSYNDGVVTATQTFAAIDAYVVTPGASAGETITIDADVLGDEFNSTYAPFHQAQYNCPTAERGPIFHFATLPGQPRFPMEFQLSIDFTPGP